MRILGITLLLSICSGCVDPCGNDEVARVPSPDVKYEAVVFQRDCGATTDFSTQISVLPKGDSLPGAVGNVFIADSSHGAAPRATWGGGPAVDVRWSANRRLSVATHPAARISRNVSTVSVSAGILNREQVTVEYMLKDSSGGAVQPAAGADR